MGGYTDLSALENLKQLKYLYIGSGAGVRDITSLGKLENLIVLHVENFKRIEDYSVFITLRKLEQLIISGPIIGRTPIKDLEFLREMKNLVSVGLPNTTIKKKYTLEELEDLRRCLFKVYLMLSGLNVEKIKTECIDEVVNFSWGCCQDKYTGSYPIYTDSKEIEKEYMFRITHKEGAVLVCRSDKELLGVMCLFTQSSDKILQTTAFYVKANNTEVSRFFLNYIERNYPNYTIYIGITSENETVAKALSEYGYKVVDDCLDLRLNMNSIYEYTICNNIFRVDEEMLPRYLEYHSEHFNDGYWNEVRLQSDFANWDIYISFDEDTITGGMFATSYPDGNLEIFGLEAIDEICYRRLLEFAITNLKIRHMNASELVFLAPVDNKVLIMAARQVGFSITNTYQCWEKSFSGE